MPTDPKNFYVGIFRDGEELKGHSFAASPELAADLTEAHKEDEDSRNDNQVTNSKFLETINSFIETMNMYRNFISITFSMGTAIVPAMSEALLERFVKENGQSLAEYKLESRDVYELNIEHLRGFLMRQDEIKAASQGVSHLPEVMVIGLISSYDAFLGNLLKSIFYNHEEMVFSSEKTVTFNEISRFSSMQEAKDHLMNKEVESVLRKSHHEQFSWMEGNFRMQLRSNLHIWPEFIEICERRNLLTHTGGHVSQQYIDNCKEHKCSIGDAKIGDKLGVSHKYFSESVNAVSEIGVKLAYVMWRKFSKAEQDGADVKYNMICFDLIIRRSYKLAEDLLRFGVGVLAKGGNERTRRMMIVNLANAIRLQGDKNGAERIIDIEDWSATGLDFQICSNAAKGNVDEVVRLMQVIGAKDRRIDAESYRNWPVFRGIRKEKSFREGFEQIFGQKLIKPGAVLVQSDRDPQADFSESKVDGADAKIEE